MPKRVWRGKLNNTRQLNRLFNRALHGFFIRMMAAYHVVRTLFNPSPLAGEGWGYHLTHMLTVFLTPSPLVGEGWGEGGTYLLRGSTDNLLAYNSPCPAFIST